jgi:hypothetical protein
MGGQRAKWMLRKLGVSVDWIHCGALQVSQQAIMNTIMSDLVK